MPNLVTPTFTDGDVNGDGVIDGADHLLITSQANVNMQNIWILADLDGNGVVDEDDLDILYDNYLANLSNPTQADGDLNGDGVIDLDDLDLMFAQYGLELDMVA